MVLCAVAAFLLQKARRVVTIVATAIFVTLLLLTWALAQYVHGAFWLLLIPIAILAIIFLLMRLVATFIEKRLYRHPFTGDQREQLSDFTHKIAELGAARQTPPQLFVGKIAYDIIRYRDPRTLRKIIDDSSSLKGDFSRLSTHFSER